MFDAYDLHVHTLFSDGQRDLDEVLRTLVDLGVEVVGLADHVFPGAVYKHEGVGLTTCYSTRRLRYRKDVIRLYDRKYSEIMVLNGAEVDVYPHGGLTLPRGTPPSFFDYLMVAKHHTLPKPVNLFSGNPGVERWLWRHSPRLRLNKRLWFKGLHAAFRRFHPQIFAHPQEGMPKWLERRDFEQLAALCVRYGVALELNHFPEEDLGELLEVARDRGVKFSIGSDFHGFRADVAGQLAHSREMAALARRRGLELLDPRDFARG
ncbi:MAG: hypothetical protein Kow0069_02650 [Promethearchaeota archaeon]